MLPKTLLGREAECLRAQMRASTIRSVSLYLVLRLVFFSALIASPRSKDRAEKGKEYIYQGEAARMK